MIAPRGVEVDLSGGSEPARVGASITPGFRGQERRDPHAAPSVGHRTAPHSPTRAAPHTHLDRPRPACAGGRTAAPRPPHAAPIDRHPGPLLRRHRDLLHRRWARHTWRPRALVLGRRSPPRPIANYRAAGRTRSAPSARACATPIPPCATPTFLVAVSTPRASPR